MRTRVTIALSHIPFLNSNEAHLFIQTSSFGFGGANVHAILENYLPGSLTTQQANSPPVAVFTPFVFSAVSETSLLAYLQRFHEYLQKNAASLNLRDLGYTLNSRRTGFQVVTAIAASSVDELSRKIAMIRDGEEGDDKPVISRISRRMTSQHGGHRFLGVFVSDGLETWADITQILTANYRLDKVPNLQAWGPSC